MCVCTLKISMVVVGATDLTDDFGSSVRGGYGRPPPSCFPGPILPVYDVQVKTKKWDGWKKTKKKLEIM